MCTNHLVVRRGPHLQPTRGMRLRKILPSLVKTVPEVRSIFLGSFTDGDGPTFGAVLGPTRHTGPVWLPIPAAQAPARAWVVT